MANYYIVAGIPFSGELYHHGIKGQKWGVRRFENQDGTLTAAGKQRYRGDRYGNPNVPSNWQGALQAYGSHYSRKKTGKTGKASADSMATHTVDTGHQNKPQQGSYGSTYNYNSFSNIGRNIKIAQQSLEAIKAIDEKVAQAEYELAYAEYYGTMTDEAGLQKRRELYTTIHQGKQLKAAYEQRGKTAVKDIFKTIKTIAVSFIHKLFGKKH